MNTTLHKIMSVALMIGGKHVICVHIGQGISVISYSIKLNQVYNMGYGNIDNRG